MIREDREKRLKAILNSDNIIVITTQTLEAGVDTSFDLMIRELAPLPSLVQALGRVNRYGKGANARFVILNVVSAKDRVEWLPYEKDAVLRTQEFVLKNKFKDKVEFELKAHNVLQQQMASAYDLEKDYVDYVNEVFNKLIWSVKALSDVVSLSSLRNEGGLPRYTVRVIVDEDEEQRLKELYERVKETFSRESLLEYLQCLVKVRGHYIHSYVPRESMSWEEYRSQWLGESVDGA
jgi:ATP-dependent helicase YprA (DUF1998 family)